MDVDIKSARRYNHALGGNDFSARTDNHTVADTIHNVRIA